MTPDGILQALDPRFLPALVPATFVTKWFVSILKKISGLQGNVVQALAFVMAVPVVGAVAYCMGIFDEGFHRLMILGWAFASFATAVSAIGVHEVSVDANDPPSASSGDVMGQTNVAHAKGE